MIKTPNHKKRKIDQTIVNQFCKYDRYFTKPIILQEIATVVMEYLPKHHTFIDFSCGKNEFVTMLQCPTLSFDIVPVHGSITQDWFSVKSLPEKCCIGLNPPFGYKSSTAKRFVKHAISFKPSFLFLILPIINWKPDHYRIVYEKKLPFDTFYLPNTKEDFCYPTFFYVFKRDLTYCPSKKVAPVFLGVDIHCHVKKVNEEKNALLLRRVGYYAGRQFYVIYKKQITYVHKGKEENDKTWINNNHSIDNSFWVIYFNIQIEKEKLISLCNYFISVMEKETKTTRKEDVRHAPSLIKANVHKILVDFFNKK